MISIDYYKSLATSQHRNKPVFGKTIGLFCSPILDLSNFVNLFVDAFKVDVAIGNQLDIIGEWVGISRKISAPTGTYFFEWNTDNFHGWNSGSWKSSSTPTGGFVVLPDDLYRASILCKIEKNKWDGSSSTTNLIGQKGFPGLNINFKTNTPGKAKLYLSGKSLQEIEAAIVLSESVLPKPAGISIEPGLVQTGNYKIFSWRTNTALEGGWRTSAF